MKSPGGEKREREKKIDARICTFLPSTEQKSEQHAFRDGPE
jgi:hypothetical protein